MVEAVAPQRARGAGQQEHGRTAGHFFDLRGWRVLSFFALVIVASMACCRGAQHGSSASLSAQVATIAADMPRLSLCLLSVLSGLQMRPTAAFARLRCIRNRMITMRQSMMQQQTLVWTSSSNLPCVRGQKRV